MAPSLLDEILHRVHNLLGTIEIQAEVARGDGSPAALGAALDVIVAAGRRARSDLLRLCDQARRAAHGDAGGAESRT